jgi:GAF domain-containing protein
MTAAPFPTAEPARLRALRASGLLESGADPRLDAIVRRAAAMFGAPIAAISLLDRTTQHFKASVGLGVPNTPREVAFCGYVILGTGPLIVPDALLDPRFADNALVLGAPGIRFYAGVPVHGPEQQPLGALCVLDTNAHPAITPGLIGALTGMAAEVTALFAAPRPRPGDAC